MEDGLYVCLFAIRNGVRYDFRIMGMKDVTKIMVDSMMEGLFGTNTNQGEVNSDGQADTESFAVAIR